MSPLKEQLTVWMITALSKLHNNVQQPRLAFLLSSGAWTLARASPDTEQLTIDRINVLLQ